MWEPILTLASWGALIVLVVLVVAMIDEGRHR